jgi:hypothetical protein
MSKFTVGSNPYKKSYISENNVPIISLGHLPTEKIEQAGFEPEQVKQTIKEYFDNKTRLQDIDLEELTEYFGGWFEALLHVLHTGCGKMTTAHFEDESIRALVVGRDFIVRENIKGNRKKNPELLKDRSILIGDASATLASHYGLRLKPLSDEAALFKHFGRARYTQPDIVTAKFEKGLEAKEIKKLLELLETQGSLVVKYHQNTDQHTMDLLAFLGAIFQSVFVLHSESEQKKAYFAVCKDLNKDLYQHLKGVLDKAGNKFEETSMGKTLYKFNRSVHNAQYKEPKDANVTAWFEAILTTI